MAERDFEEYLEKNGLYADEDDRKYLEALPEVERERILYRRWKDVKEVEEKRQLMELNRPKIAEPKPTRVCFEDCDFIVKRSLLTSNVFKPFFNKFKGCFTRARIGTKYFICKIAAIEEKEQTYPLPDQHNLKTNIYLTLDTGSKICKQFELFNISSNSMLTEEFEAFLEAFKISSAGPLNEKYKRLKQDMERNLTDEEIVKMVANRMKNNPRKKTDTQQKIELILRRDEAVAAKNKEEARKYQALLEKIEDSERERIRQQESEEIDEAKKRLRNH